MCRFCDYAGEPIVGCVDVAEDRLPLHVLHDVVARRLSAAWWEAMQGAVYGARSGQPTGLLGHDVRGVVVDELHGWAPPAPRPTLAQPRPPLVDAHPELLTPLRLCELVRSHPGAPDGVTVVATPDPDRPGQNRFIVAVDPAVRPPAAP